jgi:hypothetical protein
VIAWRPRLVDLVWVQRNSFAKRDRAISSPANSSWCMTLQANNLVGQSVEIDWIEIVKK